jgi:hypothetical protein
MRKTASGHGYRLLGTWTIQQQSEPAEPVDIAVRSAVETVAGSLAADADDNCADQRASSDHRENEWSAVGVE